MSKSRVPVLPAMWQVPEIFRQRLGAKAGRQRAMLADEHLLLVLHVPPKPDEDERKARFFWRNPEGVWACNESGGPGALKKHLDEYAEVIDKCDELEDNASSAEDYFKVIEILSPIHRAARNLHTVLQEARQQVPHDRELINYRDRAYDIERTASLLYTSAQNSLEFAVALRAEEQANAARQMSVAAHRLNILAAFFFPIATLSSVFGMSILDNWKEGAPPMLFIAIIIVGLAIGIFLKSWVTSSSRNH